MKYHLKYRTTHPVRTAVSLALGVSILLGSLSAYGSNASDLAKERVAQSDASVEQAQQTLGKSEHGAVELQQAREKLNAAKSALAEKEWKQAERSAAQAHLFAELAVAKSQSADARKSANEVLASLEILRQETERSSPTQR
jgi:hypothetical protein